MNYKRKAEAQALASSAVNFAVVVFDLQKQLKPFLDRINLKIEIWDIVPFDTQLLRSFTTAGPFVDVEDVVAGNNQKEEGKVAGSIQNAETDETYTETGDPIFKFPGDFRIDFESEDTKINLNHLAYGSRVAIIKMLEGIIEPEFYDFLFLENTSRHEYVERAELIQNIVDWVDVGDDKYTDGEKYISGGDEQSAYDDFVPQYKVKNSRFDTKQELLMVYGITPVIFRILDPYTTIYSTGKININKASPFMLEALIRAYAVDKASTVFYNEDAMREFLGKILAKKAKDGFSKVTDFTQACMTEGVELSNDISKVLDVEGSVYRIKATGVKEGVESWVEMVVDKEGNIYYYREG
jgi:type II secretory pathway component PulK